MTPAVDLFLRFGAALAIGFLIGLQREFAHSNNEGELTAGERTFALVSLSGCLAAMIADLLGSPAILIALIVVVGVVTAISYFTDAWLRRWVGITSEISLLIAVLIGVLCYHGQLALAAALGISVTVVLSLKLQTDQFVRALTRQEVYAALQLAVISVIVLPLLPNQSMAAPPFDVLNPFKAWLMVVFISGINFVGYILTRVAGPQGIGLTGFLGGLVSSTAVTLSFSERSKREPDLARPFAFAIITAWTVMFARVLVEVSVLNPALLKEVWLPITLAGAAGLLYGVFLFFKQHPSDKSDLELTNPLDLKSAIRFGLFFILILLISRTAQFYFGDAGILISSLVSGLADVDAITLSVSELSRVGSLGLNTAKQAIVVATVANTIAKGGLVLASGDARLRKALLPGLALILVTAVAVGFLA